MGYWNTDSTGASFADGGDLVWGDSPADAIDQGIENVRSYFDHHELDGPSNGYLIDLLNSVLETPDQMGAAATAMRDAVREASKWFLEDIGRDPSGEEIKAGLLFSLGGGDDE